MCGSVRAETLARVRQHLYNSMIGEQRERLVFYSHQANSDAVNISGYYWSRPSRRKPSQQGRGSQPFHNNVYVVNAARVPLQICFLDVTDEGQTSVPWLTNKWDDERKGCLRATILLDFKIWTISRLTSYSFYFLT